MRGDDRPHKTALEPTEKSQCDVVTSLSRVYMAATMIAAIDTGRLDRIAMGVSGLCLVHCLASAILLGLLSAAGGILGSPIIHEMGLVLAMALGAVALGKGVFEHGFVLPSAVGGLGLGVMSVALSLPHSGGEAMVTVAGVMILALGHRLNRIAGE
jgi:hypothetical protein